MKRDMDLVRKILFAMEDYETGFVNREIKIDGYSEEEVGYHVYIMDEAGLLVRIDATHRGSSSPEAIPSRLTWAGYDFLDACRDEGRWNKAKGVINNIGGASFEVVKTVLVELMKNQATQFIS